MYEKINTDLVMAAFDAKAQRLKDLYGESSLTVRKARPVAGWPGGNPLTRSGKFAVFSLSRLRQILWASCALGFACLGDIVVRAKGLLIGQVPAQGRHLVDAIYSVSFDFNDPSDEQAFDEGSAASSYSGTVKAFNDAKGWGFIDSAAAKRIFLCEIFLHKNELGAAGGVNVGDQVRFTVDVSNGRATAKNALGGGNGGAGGSVTANTLKNRFDASSAPQCLLRRNDPRQAEQEFFDAVDFFAAGSPFDFGKPRPATLRGCEPLVSARCLSLATRRAQRLSAAPLRRCNPETLLAAC
eukprot:s2687_g5.t1